MEDIVSVIQQAMKELGLPPEAQSINLIPVENDKDGLYDQELEAYQQELKEFGKDLQEREEASKKEDDVAPRTTTS